MQDFINVQDLSFSYGGPNILQNVCFQLPQKSRCLLVGLNGSGKSTLLRILAGKRLTKGKVYIQGRHAYHDTLKEITYLGPEWAANPVVRRDVTVSALLESIDAKQWPERRDQLLSLLDIDLNWHMHQISDGERRRVQILLGLVAPFKVLLLDEVTIDLDVVVRRNLLNFLRDEEATIIYATHIFDGLGQWPTHLLHLHAGEIKHVSSYNELTLDHSQFDSPLLMLVEKWLQSDFESSKKRRQMMQQSQTKWQALSEDAKQHGDKYYNYWQ